MTIAAVRTAIADACRTVSGLHASEYVPDQVQPPMAVVGTVAFDPRLVMGEGKCVRDVMVRVYVGRTAETAAQKLVDTYSELSGATSVIAALQSATALNNGSTADYVEVVHVRGPLTETVGTIDYLVLEFDLEACF